MPKCDVCVARDGDEEAVVWRACYNQDCQETTYFYLCADHAPVLVTCARCGGKLTEGPLEEPTDRDASQGRKHQRALDRQEKEEPKLLQADELLMKCQAKGAVVHSNEMAVEVQVGNGFKRVAAVLGHSFHAMRAAEKAIRKQCGVSVSRQSATGTNIALMELRLLLVDADCNVYQIAVQFHDAVGRNILLCSTGGVVLTEESEIVRLASLQNKNAASPEELLVLAELKKRKAAGNSLVRCCASQEGYARAQLFAFCGSSSFFNPGDRTGEDLRVAARAYAKDHDGKYRESVHGPANDQLFHHSEQAGFKALFQYPDLLSLVVTQARGKGKLPSTRLSLEAVSIDLFTTRSVCNGCMDCAVCVLTQDTHFFSQALRILVKEHSDIVIDRVRKLIRFDCEVAFKDGLLTRPLAKNCLIVHGIPRKVQGSVPNTRGTSWTVLATLPCNRTPNPILASGSQRQFLPAIIGQIKEQLQLATLPEGIDGLARLFGKLMGLFGKDLHSGVVAAAFLINKFCGEGGHKGRMVHLQGAATKLGTQDPSMALAVKLSYFFDFLRPFEKLQPLQRCALVSSASLYFGCTAFDDQSFEALRLAYAYVYEQDLAGEKANIRQATQDMIVAVIKGLLMLADSTAENAARILALHFDVLEAYRKLLD